MSSSVKQYRFEFDPAWKGIDQFLEQVGKAILESSALTDLKITMIFKSLKHPEEERSAVYERKLALCLSSKGVPLAQYTAIEKALNQLGYSIDPIHSLAMQVVDPAPVPEFSIKMERRITHSLQMKGISKTNQDGIEGAFKEWGCPIHYLTSVY